MNRPSLGEVLNQLGHEGRLAPERVAQATIAPGEGGPTAPWHVRFMVGFGAGLAAIFFIGFFTLLTHSRPAALFFGALLLTGAILVRRLDKGDLLNQFSFAASLAGQLLILHGANLQTMTGLALLALAMQGVVIAFYADQSHRLLSTLLAVVAVEVLLHQWKWTYGTVVLAGLLAIVSSRLWLGEAACFTPRLERLVRPVAYGLVIAMLGLLLPSVFAPAFAPGNPLRQHAHHLWPGAILLGATLLHLARMLMKERNLPPFGGVAMSVHGAILLLMWPALQAPGLIGALIVLLLGFRRGNRLLLGMALLFLAVFLSAYYYHLAISLLQKSAALAGSGAVLLGLRWMLLRKFAQDGNDHAH